MAGGFPREAVSLRCPPLPSRNFIVPIADPGGLREEAEGGAAFCAPFAMGSTTLIMRGGVPPPNIPSYPGNARPRSRSTLLPGPSSADFLVKQRKLYRISV